MTEFVLRTRTERRLYVEALLSCLDRDTLTAQQACQDILDIGRTGNLQTESAERSISTRIDGIIAAYLAKTIDERIAIKNLAQVLDAIAPEVAY